MLSMYYPYDMIERACSVFIYLISPGFIFLNSGLTCDLPTPVVPTIVIIFFFGLVMMRFLVYLRYLHIINK